jgi:hypothetical protein
VSGIEASAISTIRFPLTLREVVLLAAAAVRDGEQGPAVGRDLEGGLKHGKPEGLQALAGASPTRRRELCSQTKR